MERSGKGIGGKPRCERRRRLRAVALSAALVSALLASSLVAATAHAGQRARPSHEPQAMGELRRQVLERLGQVKGRWAVYFHDMRTDEGFERRARRVYHAASTMKILVMMKVFLDVRRRRYRLDDELRVADTFRSAVPGAEPFTVSPKTYALRRALGGTLTVRQLLEQMVVHSDNLATNLLIRRAGGAEAITAYARRQGLKRSTVARFVSDIAAFRAGLSSHATAREYGRLLERLWQGRVVSKRYSKEMLAILSRVETGSLHWRLPEGARVAHKSGSIRGLRHDVGLFFLPDGGAFVLCVLSDRLRDGDAAREAIADVAALVWRNRVAQIVPPPATEHPPAGEPGSPPWPKGSRKDSCPEAGRHCSDRRARLALYDDGAPPARNSGGNSAAWPGYPRVGAPIRIRPDTVSHTGCIGVPSCVVVLARAPGHRIRRRP